MLAHGPASCSLFVRSMRCVQMTQKNSSPLFSYFPRLLRRLVCASRFGASKICCHAVNDWGSWEPLSLYAVTSWIIHCLRDSSELAELIRGCDNSLHQTTICIQWAANCWLTWGLVGESSIQFHDTWHLIRAFIANWRLWLGCLQLQGWSNMSWKPELSNVWWNCCGLLKTGPRRWNE
jgi:hypothetical protein